MMTSENPVSKQPCCPWAAAAVALSDRRGPCPGCRLSRGHLIVWLPPVTVAKKLINACHLALQPLAYDLPAKQKVNV